MPSFLRESKTVDICGECGEKVTIPPGVYYRGVAYHKQAAERRRRLDFGEEVKAPALAEIERELHEVLED